jgi:hypothetical protein
MDGLKRTMTNGRDASKHLRYRILHVPNDFGAELGRETSKRGFKGGFGTGALIVNFSARRGPIRGIRLSVRESDSGLFSN